MALVITLSYMLMGRLNNDNDSWVQVSLPLSSASLLLVSLAAAETYLHVQRTQRKQEELEAARDRELELSQRLAFQRQSTLNQISRALIDKLDVAQMSTEVLEKIAQLFEADLVAAWVAETTATHTSYSRAHLVSRATMLNNSRQPSGHSPCSSSRTRNRVNSSSIIPQKPADRSSICANANASLALR